MGGGCHNGTPTQINSGVVEVKKHAFIRDVHVCMHMALHFCITVQL